MRSRCGPFGTEDGGGGRVSGAKEKVRKGGTTLSSWVLRMRRQGLQHSLRNARGSSHAVMGPNPLSCTTCWMQAVAGPFHGPDSWTRYLSMRYTSESVGCVARSVLRRAQSVSSIMRPAPVRRLVRRSSTKLRRSRENSTVLRSSRRRSTLWRCDFTAASTSSQSRSPRARQTAISARVASWRSTVSSPPPPLDGIESESGVAGDGCVSTVLGEVLSPHGGTTAAS
mmetsp:Transcript_65301/g.155736  ORF Transcript_65301/g.155736 Transcript_65301/m.155736 type:complete len:226 (-) Transcript_65301:37-714(-)